MSDFHRVQGLRSVEKLASSPWPKGRLSGFAAQGKRYEKQIAKALPKSLHNPWFRFVDSTGQHCCSPDILLPYSKGIAILECKLTYTLEAAEQLRFLYIPIVSAYYFLPTFGIIVVKDLGRDYFGPRPKATLKECLGASGSQFPVLLASAPTPSHLRAQFYMGP